MIRHVKLLVILFLIANGLVIAQTTTLTSGSTINGSSGSVSYSVGQVFYTTNTGTSGAMIHGVQQPFEISVLTAINNTSDVLLECFIFPNPTRGRLRLMVETDAFKNLRFQLYDSYGTLLQDKKIENDETEILLDNYLSAVYFLKVLSGSKEIKTFKIIKL